MKKSVLIFSLLCAIVTLGMSSCNSSRKTTSTGNNYLQIGSMEWRLLSVLSNDEREMLVPDKQNVPTLRITTDGNANGFAGCNSFTGPVSFDANSIKFGNLAMTRKYCMESMDIETALANAFSNVDNYTIQNGDLQLKKGSKVLATFSSYR